MGITNKLGLRTAFTAFFMLTAINCSGNTLKTDDAYSLTDKQFIHQYENSGRRFKLGKTYEVNGQSYQPKHEPSYSQVGMASWYDSNVGTHTASGERYDPNLLTAAHPTLPLPSIVKVTNLSNGNEVMVRVNDRGPFSSKRIIDVSKAAAQQLGMIRSGTAKVKVELQQEATLNYLKADNSTTTPTAN